MCTYICLSLKLRTRCVASRARNDFSKQPAAMDNSESSNISIGSFFLLMMCGWINDRNRHAYLFTFICLSSNSIFALLPFVSVFYFDILYHFIFIVTHLIKISLVIIAILIEFKDSDIIESCFRI